MEMPEKLKQRRDELFPSLKGPFGHSDSKRRAAIFNSHKREGFNAAWEELAPELEKLRERERVLVEALKWYAEEGRPCPTKARLTLKKLEGE